MRITGSNALTRNRRNTFFVYVGLLITLAVVLRGISPDHSLHAPVRITFCALLQDIDQVGTQRFVTYTTIAPAFPHAAMLENPDCPKRSASFIEELDRNDFEEELTRRLQANPYDPVPIVFEGVMYHPPLFKELYYDVRRFFGLSGDTHAPVIIKAYQGIGVSAWAVNDAGR